MRITALFFAMLALLGCSPPAPKQTSHMTDIFGAMPKLDFHLTRASDGARVTGDTYHYKAVALYFGYTHCPDVCPATLANLADIAAKAPGLTILFVTVDPDRDTNEVLKDYTKAFSPNVEGLRGNANELADLARRYRVAYSVKKGPPYEVMHSNAVFFFDWDRSVRFVTTDTTDTMAIAADAKRLPTDLSGHY